MIYTTKELIELGENDYSIRKKVADESLFAIERGLYSTNREERRLDEVAMCKKVSAGILFLISFILLQNSIVSQLEEVMLCSHIKINLSLKLV